MKCSAKYGWPMLMALGLITPAFPSLVAAPQDQAALHADREFVGAAANGDKEAVARLLVE